jgi:hypothetical protein
LRLERSFQSGTLFVSIERFPFAQDTAISVRSGGIKPEYAFFKFLQSIILVLFRFCIIYFRVATLLDLRMLFASRPVQSRQIRNRKEKVHLPGKLIEI